MRNNYKIRGGDIAIFIRSKKYGEFETLISKSEFKTANDFPNTWYAHLDKPRNVFYVAGSMQIEGKTKTVLLHRWLTHAPNDMQVDHINHDTLDNRNENLRLVSASENQQNRRRATRNSTTRIRGVHWHKRVGKWEVQIRLNGKKISIGYFDELKEAEKAAIEARRKYMPFSQESIS